MNNREFQAWLNRHGASIDVDGKFGPLSRAAMLDVFKNTEAPAIGRGGIIILSNRLGCGTKQIMAAAMTESAGSGWDNSGLLKILWERHYLWRRVKKAVPWISNPRPGDYTLDANRNKINDSWEKLALAVSYFGPDIAFECASFGKFQIMGAWWKDLGYVSALDFVYGMTRDEEAHYEAFARYIEHNNLERALRQIDGQAFNCRAFARGYNGPNYAAGNYHGKIAANFRKL